MANKGGRRSTDLHHLQRLQAEQRDGRPPPIVDSRSRDPCTDSHFPLFPSLPLFALLPPHMLLPPRILPPNDALPAISPPMRTRDSAWYLHQPIRGESLMWSAGHRPIGEPAWGDWPMRAEEIGGDNRLMGRGRCLSLVFRRSVYTRTSQHSKVEANTASLKRMFMDPTDFVEYLALSLWTGFYIPPRIFCEHPKLFPNTSLQLPNPIIWPNLWNQWSQNRFCGRPD